MVSTCVLNAAGQVYCWGAWCEGHSTHINFNGRYGVYFAKDIECGRFNMCAILDDGSVKCIGPNDLGQLGLGNTDGFYDEENGVPAVDLYIYEAIGLAGGSNSMCAVLENGYAYCWGDNRYGQLGRSETSTCYGCQSTDVGMYMQLIDLSPRGLSFVEIQGNNMSYCAKVVNTTDYEELEHILCWGMNVDGRLGLGRTSVAELLNESNLPVVDLGDDMGKIVSFAMGSTRSCAVSENGFAKCWGGNVHGRLGNGNTWQPLFGDDISDMGDNLPQVSLGESVTVKKIVCGQSHSCALLLDNSNSQAVVKCWGSNDYLQLGTDNFANDPVWISSMLGDNLPAVDLGGENITNLVTKGAHTCVLLDSGEVKCWGRSDDFQCGYGGVYGNNVGSSAVMATLPTVEVPWACEISMTSSSTTTTTTITFWAGIPTTTTTMPTTSSSLATTTNTLASSSPTTSTFPATTTSILASSSPSTRSFPAATTSILASNSPTTSSLPATTTTSIPATTGFLATSSTGATSNMLRTTSLPPTSSSEIQTTMSNMMTPSTTKDMFSSSTSYDPPFGPSSRSPSTTTVPFRPPTTRVPTTTYAHPPTTTYAYLPTTTYAYPPSSSSSSAGVASTTTAPLTTTSLDYIDWNTSAPTTSSPPEPCPDLPALDAAVFDAASIELCAGLLPGEHCLVACAGSDSTCSDSTSCHKVSCSYDLTWNITETSGKCQPDIAEGCFSPYLIDLSVSFSSSASDTSTVACTGTSEGSTCALGCDTDYYTANELQGLICDAEGSFQGTLQEACVPKACSDSPSFYTLSENYVGYSFSETDCAGKLHLETCQLECSNGQTTTAGYLQCVGSTWTMQLEPVCGEVTCSLDQLPEIQNGAAICTEDDGPFVDGSICAIACQANYTLSGELLCTDGSWGMSGGLGCRISSSGTNKTTALLGSLQIMSLGTDSTTGEASASDSVESTLTTLESTDSSASSSELASILSESLRDSDLSPVESALTVFSSRGTLAMLETALVVGAEASSEVSEQQEVAAALMEQALVDGLDAGDAAEAIVSGIVASSVSATSQAALLSGLALSLRLDRMLAVLSSGNVTSEASRRLRRLTIWGPQALLSKVWPLYEALTQWDSEAIRQTPSWLTPSSETSARPQALLALTRSAGTGVRYADGTALQAFAVGPYLAAAALAGSKDSSVPAGDALEASLATLGAVVTQGSDSSFWRIDNFQDSATQLARIAALLVSEGWISKAEDAATILSKASAMLIQASLTRAEAMGVAVILAIERTNEGGSRICTTRTCLCEVARVAGDLLKIQGGSFFDAAHAALMAVLGVADVASGDKNVWSYTAALAAASAFGEHALAFASETLMDELSLYSTDEASSWETRYIAEGLAMADEASGARFLELIQDLAASPGDYLLTTRSNTTLTQSEVAIAIRRAFPIGSSLEGTRALGWSRYKDWVYAPLGLLELGYATEEELILADRANFERSEKYCEDAVFDRFTTDDLDVPKVLGLVTSACLTNQSGSLASIVYGLLSDHWTNDDAYTVLEAFDAVVADWDSITETHFDLEDAFVSLTIDRFGNVQIPYLASLFWALHHWYGSSLVAPLSGVFLNRNGASEDAAGTVVDTLLTTVGPYFATVYEVGSDLSAALADFRYSKPFGNALFSNGFVTARAAVFMKAKPWTQEVYSMSFSAAMSSNPITKGRRLLGGYHTEGDLLNIFHQDVTYAGWSADVVARATQSLDALVEANTEVQLSSLVGAFSEFADEFDSPLTFVAAAYDAILASSERSFSFKETITLVTETALAQSRPAHQISPTIGLVVLLRDGTYEGGVDRLRAVRSAMHLSASLVSVDDISQDLNCSATVEITYNCDWMALTSLVTEKTSMYMGIQDVFELAMVVEESEAVAYLASSQLDFIAPLGVVLGLSERVRAVTGTLNMSALLLEECQEEATTLSAAQAQGSVWFALRGGQSYQPQFAFNTSVSIGRSWGLSAVESILSVGTLALTQAVDVQDVLAWSAAWLEDEVTVGAWKQETLGALLAKTVEFEAATKTAKARASLSASVRGGDITGWQSLRHSVLTPENVQAAIAQNSYADVSVPQLLAVLLEAGYSPAEASAIVANIGSSDATRATELAQAFVAQGFDLDDDVPELLEGFSSTVLTSSIASVKSLDEVDVLFPSPPTSSLPGDRRLRVLQDTSSSSSTTTDDQLSADWAVKYQEHIAAGLASALSVSVDRVYITSITALSTSSRRLAVGKSRVLEAISAGLALGRRLATTAQGFVVAFAVTGIDPDDSSALSSLQTAISNLGNGDSTEIANFVSSLTTSLTTAGVSVPSALSGTLITSSSTSGVSTDFEIPISFWNFEDFPVCSCGPLYTITRDIVCSSGIEAACDASYYSTYGESRPNTTQVCDTPCPTSCPYGEDFFVECDFQVASTILAAVGVCLLVCCVYCCVMCRRPNTGKVKVNLDKIGSTAVTDARGKKAKFTISRWRRAKQESDDGKARIVWDTDLAKVAVAMGVSMEELEADLQLQQLAINTDTEILGGQVSLGFLAEEDWTLTATVKTKTTRASDFLCGKVFVEGNVPDVHEDVETTAKALLLLQGHVVFETGVGFLTSTSKVNDGKEHVVSISFNSAGKQLIMHVDGREEAQLSVEDGMVGDHDEAFWLTASCVDKPSLEDTPARRYPLSTLVGKVTNLTYNGKRIVNPVHVGKERPPKGYTLACKEGDPEQQAHRSEKRVHSEAFSTVNGQMPGAFAVQSKVEYFSVTHGQWVLAHVVNYQYVKKGDNFFERLHNLRLKSGTERLGVQVPLLRSVLRPGEPCSVYSVTRGVWVPAVAARTQLENPSMWGYRVYYTSELSHHHGRNVEEGLLGHHLCPVRKANSVVLRKRFDIGSRVQVWKDSTNSWVWAKVVSITPVDASAYFDDGAAGESHHESSSSRKQDHPDLPITMVPPPRKQAPDSTRQQSTLSTGTVATTVPALPMLTATTTCSGDESPPAAASATTPRPHFGLEISHRDRDRVGLALWERATVVEEVSGSAGTAATYEVETYRMRMQPEDWGKETHLPPLKEELTMVMRNGGIEVPLGSTLAEVVTQFKEEMVDEAQAVAEKGRTKTKHLTATLVARFAEPESDSDGGSDKDNEKPGGTQAGGAAALRTNAAGQVSGGNPTDLCDIVVHDDRNSVFP